MTDKKQIFDRDIKYLIRAVVIALLVMAVLHAFNPAIETKIPDEQKITQMQVEEFALQMREISAEEIRATVYDSARPTIVYIYASWCGYCKKMMPTLQKLWQEKAFDNVQFLAVSIDKQLVPLSQYILTYGYNDMLASPMVLQQDDGRALVDTMQAMGAGYSSQIPYTAFFYKGGELSHNVLGAVNYDDIKRQLHTLTSQ